MFWKRLGATSHLVLRRDKRFLWFWKYVILKKPLILELSLTVSSNNFNWDNQRYLEALFIEDFSVKEVSLKSNLFQRTVESQWDIELDE